MTIEVFFTRLIYIQGGAALWRSCFPASVHSHQRQKKLSVRHRHLIPSPIFSKGVLRRFAHSRGFAMAENHRHHRHHDHKHRDKEKSANRRDESETSKNSSTRRLQVSDGDKSSQFVGKLVIKEETSGPKPRDKRETKVSESLKGPNFLTDRRVSQAEMQRRHTWLQRTRESQALTRNRSRITHEVRFPETFNGLYSARFSPNGEVIVTGYGTGGIQVRNGETGDLRNTLRSGMEASFPIMCCRFNPIRTDTFYASSACGNIFLCTTNTNEFTRFIEEPKNEVNTVDVSIGGEYLVSGGKDAAVRLYDAEVGKLISIYQKSDGDIVEEKVGKFHRMRIFASKFHQSYPGLFITGGWDDTVRIWDVRVGDGSVRLIKGPHICGDAIDIRETNILTGSWVVRGSLQIWDMTSGKLIETIVPENRPTTLDGEFLYAVQYFDGDPYGEHVVVGGSGTGEVEIISLKEKKVMGSFRISKAVVTLDSCRTTIVFGGMESVLRLADYS